MIILMFIYFSLFDMGINRKTFVYRNINSVGHSSVPSHDTTSRFTLCPACFRRLTADAWRTSSSEWPSTESSRSPQRSLPSRAAGDDCTTKRTWMGSAPRWGSDPPTMLKPREAPVARCSTTLLDMCRERGSFCQYSQDGTKLAEPTDVSGPSRRERVTLTSSAVAFKSATACPWVSPSSDCPFTDSSTSPFCHGKIWN